MDRRAGKAKHYTVSAGARQTALVRGLVLASASPRRRELLAEARVRFQVATPAVTERREIGEPPAHMALRLAREKARCVARHLRGGLVLGADTVVVLDGRPIGKPTSSRRARAMLRALSGRRHAVLTALALVDAETGAELSGVARSTVEFAPLDEQWIRAYVATGEPTDKAGAYAIQGAAGRFVHRTWGSRTNVIGLPLELLSRLLLRAGSTLGSERPRKRRAAHGTGSR